MKEVVTAATPDVQVHETRPCLQADKHSGIVNGFKPSNVDATMSLIHDQAAPCEPAGQSHQWSCVRTMPAGEEHVPKERFGFQEADDFAKSQQCQRLRKMSDTADNGYSNRNHRLGVQRVSQGPGYLKMSINPELVKTLTAWAAKHSQFWRNQTIYQKKVFNPAESVGGCYSNTHAFPFGLLDLDNARHIRKEIVEHMQDVLEWWTDRKLDHTSTYGMRVYRREAMLINHADRGDTHIASAVLQVFQDCDKDGGWPLEVVGEDGLVREVYLQPGEMVLYEGARLLHGRPMRFKGDYFGNIFSHFKPREITSFVSEIDDL